MIRTLSQLFQPGLSPGQYAQLACLLEVTARKPGNVHREAGFEDLQFVDYLASAVAIGPVLDRAREQGVGPTVLECVRRTRELVGTNTNLGIVLLLAPLATVPPDQSLDDGVNDVLRELTLADARAVYWAIRLAEPGGLGAVTEQDVRNEPTKDLLEVMQLASGRDRIARQYTHSFEDVFYGALQLSHEIGTRDWEQNIIFCHLALMARFPDTLIARKRGSADAVEASRRAADVVQAGWPREESAQRLFAEFDAWLREDGHSRNPGTTADLVTASLFVVLRDRIMGKC